MLRRTLIRVQTHYGAIIVSLRRRGELKYVEFSGAAVRT